MTAPSGEGIPVPFPQYANEARLLDLVGEAVAAAEPGPGRLLRVAHALRQADEAVPTQLTLTAGVGADGMFAAALLVGLSRGMGCNATSRLLLEIPLSAAAQQQLAAAPDDALAPLQNLADAAVAFGAGIDDAAMERLSNGTPLNRAVQCAFSFLRVLTASGPTASWLARSEAREVALLQQLQPPARATFPTLCVRFARTGQYATINPLALHDLGLAAVQHLAWRHARDGRALESTEGTPVVVAALESAEAVEAAGAAVTVAGLRLIRAPSAPADAAWDGRNASKWGAKLTKLQADTMAACVLVGVTTGDQAQWLPHEWPAIAAASAIAADFTGAAATSSPPFVADMLSVAVATAQLVLLPDPVAAPWMWNALRRCAEAVPTASPLVSLVPPEVFEP